MSEVTNIDSILGKRLANIRKKRGLSQEELSLRIDLSRQVIQKYETAEVRIPISTLFCISKSLNVDIGYFLEGLEGSESLCKNDQIPTKRSRPLSILLIEDTVSEGLLTKSSIDSCSVGTILTCADNGDDALERLRTNPNSLPDIILLDLNMPRRNGFEVLSAIKSDRSLRHIPIIVLTNSTNHQDMKKVYDLGASGYVIKSFHPKEFNEKIRLVIDYWANIALPCM